MVGTCLEDAWAAGFTKLANWGANGRLLCWARSRIALTWSWVSVMVGACWGAAWAAWVTKPFNCSKALAWAAFTGLACCNICISCVTCEFWAPKLLAWPASFIALASDWVINRLCCGSIFWPFKPSPLGTFRPDKEIAESIAFTPLPPLSNGLTTAVWAKAGLMRPCAASWAANNCIGSVNFADSFTWLAKRGKFCIFRMPKSALGLADLSEFERPSKRATIFWFKDAKKVSKPAGTAAPPARLPGCAIASVMGLFTACICIWLTVGMHSPKGTLPTMHLSCQIWNSALLRSYLQIGLALL